jgi:hypothetical protein
VVPTDAYGRFVQVVGTLVVEARAVPATGATDAGAPVLSTTLRPGAVRDAYRSGLTGTHYSVELPLSGPAQAGDVMLRASFTDALTGATHTANLVRPVRP